MQENDQPHQVPSGGAGSARQEERGPQRGFGPGRRSFDRLIVPFSVRCMNAPLDHLDKEIEKGLKEINFYFNGDRILVWQFSDDGQQAHLTHFQSETGAELPVKSLLHETLPYIFDRIRGLENLCVSRLEDLPPSARIDIQYLERTGIRSFMVIPLLVGGALLGALSLACIRRERAWSNEDLFHFQRIGSVLAGALDRKRSQQVIEHRMQFETLITDLSARLITAPLSEVDRAIVQALEKVRHFFQGDRCGLLGVRADSRFVWTIHASYGEGIEPVSGDMNLAALYPWSYEKLVIHGDHVNVSRIADLPPEAETERQSWIATGVRSSLLVPLLIAGRVSSLIAINAIREERSWSEEYVPRLRLLGEIIINALERRNADAAVRESEERFRNMADKAPVLIWMSGKDKLCTYFNQQWLEFTGQSLEQQVGKCWADGVHPDDVERCLAMYTTSFDRREPFSREYRLRRTDGEYRWIYDTGIPRISPAGDFLGYIGSCIDITERKQVEQGLRQSEERFRQVAENVGDVIWEVDAKGLYLYMSPAVERILGYPSDELIGKKHFYDLFAPNVREELKAAALNAFAAKESFRAFPNSNVRKDGKIVHLETSGVPLLDEAGNLVGYRGSDTDVTERKRMEEQLQARLQEIEHLKQALERENIILRTEASLLFEHGDIVGESAAMRAVLSLAEQVSRTDATVLIMGETGTGKELLAREIHAMSSRKNRPLVTVNCASLPPTLIESELFGREKGAFTGALTRMAGRFEVADGSTIFLDEIAELPLDLQSKLLRVIEEGVFERLGSTKALHVNVRIIAATNRDVLQEVQNGDFRRDLYYRLNVFPIMLPPLRERPEDIPLLVWSFVRHYEKKMGKQIENIPKRSMDALQHYPSPGNVRELRNVIEHAMIISRSKVLDVRIPSVSNVEQSEIGNLEAVERRHILTALQKSGWRITGAGGAAEALGLKRTTLQSRMKKLGIERPAI